MRRIKGILFFNNGNTFVADEHGRQMGELQEPWILLYAKFLESKGIDPTQVVIDLPNGDKAEIFRTSEGGLNWNIGGFRSATRESSRGMGEKHT